MTATPFDELSHTGQIARLRQVAQRMIDRCNLSVVGMKLLAHCENTTFRVDASPKGRRQRPRRYALRIHRPDGHSVESILAELDWIKHLRTVGGLRVPTVIGNAWGDLITTVDDLRAGGTRHGVLFDWMEGRLSTNRFSHRRARQLGEFVGRFHKLSRQGTSAPRFPRPRWDWEGMLGDCGTFPSRAADKRLSKQNRLLLDQVSLKVRAAMESVPPTGRTFGRIHGDLKLEHCFFSEDGLGVIDFDDCCTGYFLYDLATPMSQLVQQDRDGTKRAELLAGYCEHQPLTCSVAPMLDDFIAALRVVSVRWICLRWDNPRVRQWGPGFVEDNIQALTQYVA